ncbi:glycosyltransferase family 4 protein [Clostridium tagluense]|uniref:glycosyltransferase family 4 protein n=1 Tax=Clostridium tagluense TaxID=360422 RepID=UPI001CF47FC4|nr:glycosyltransferase family 4 protein [Clostridium tagluense]MCB2310548.1 glycosyltransferase family 4 protein [Clostridium tagluense]MCB2315286.1 glycosyltransferase family 4 protein [Clostridium tagluense]MCB2320137.1 glycosyltransferase family 4 protein [Clostridium tagluense]MCB2325028.1 glycosyltransferase family 4 protein [Clostridium tagluense]MCB2329880.1 glycosyltransferase family 4 protein [Clostridium tagluense]
MNILYISHEMELGGATIALLELIDEMILKGNNVFVTVIAKEGAFYEEISKREVKLIIVTYYFWLNKKIKIKSKVKFLYENIINIINARKISRIIKENKIDLIHTNTSVVNFGLLLSKYTGIPHIFHVREFAERGLNFKYFLSKKKCLSFIYKYSEKIIVISKALYDENLKNFSKDKLTLIYDGVSIRNLKKKSENIKTLKSFNIMIVGEVAPHKRTKDVVLAVNNLIKKGYDEIMLFIVGNGNEDYIQEIRGVIKENNIEENVILMGFRVDIDALRAGICLEVVCSGSEGFGRVTIEAMFNENPVIGANNTATGELIINNFNGLLYETGDYIGLSEKIKYFIDNPDEIERMGVNGHSYAIERFTSKRNAEEIYKLYNEILKS